MGYHTNDELVGLARELAARAGSRAVAADVGHTVLGRAMVGVQVALPGREPSLTRPQALITANIHGNEVIASEVALRLLDLLTGTDLGDPARDLLSLGDTTLIPAINLDARESAARGLKAGRLWTRASRANRHNVDLNRNFPQLPHAQDVWHPVAGNGVPWMPWYRGPAPLSEPETRSLAGIARARRFRAAVNLHSVGRLFVYPYACLRDEPPDAPAFRAMGLSFQAAQRGRTYKIANSRSWYGVMGGLDDWLYATFGTLSVTVELARPLAGVGMNPLLLACPLAWMNPRDPESTIEETAEACLRALGEGMRPR
jgi:predicted deacylase